MNTPNTTTAQMPVPQPIPRSQAAERMRIYRKRRRRGQRCIRILLDEPEIDALIEKGFLQQIQRQDPDAILGAVYDILSQALGDPSLRVTPI
jgi:hypothetical protein